MVKWVIETFGLELELKRLVFIQFIGGGYFAEKTCQIFWTLFA